MVCGGGGGYENQPLHNPPQPLHTPRFENTI